MNLNLAEFHAGLSAPPRTVMGMSPTCEQCFCTPASARLAEAQEKIRALVTRGALSSEERLELARWQRAWVQAWRDTRYVPAA